MSAIPTDKMSVLRCTPRYPKERRFAVMDAKQRPGFPSAVPSGKWLTWRCKCLGK